MKTNSALVCLFNNYSRNVSKLLGDKLDMFYVDVEDMLDFELGDIEHIKDVLGDVEGANYINRSREKVIESICGFENTVITMDPSVLFESKTYKKVSNSCYIVYLQISPKYFESRAKSSSDHIPDDLLGIAFSERDKQYVEGSDIVVDCSKLKETKATKKIIGQIKKMFKANS